MLSSGLHYLHINLLDCLQCRQFGLNPLEHMIDIDRVDSMAHKSMRLLRIPVKFVAVATVVFCSEGFDRIVDAFDCWHHDIFVSQLPTDLSYGLLSESIAEKLHYC